jgi:hypothetical protein
MEIYLTLIEKQTYFLLEKRLVYKYNSDKLCVQEE